ncbi:uncharacterized protein Bfra_011732 [Botrytis fragariae]|uniref:Uncharacterized protein n=1 Tax=Botrytis fragariae TaxID=1964551 RepID=A0A8H6EEB4_9HELO|nr:uncharacterized protein Bfra_011732 [Botrytis fragariae]KAF5869189.1 hypothetical protein Bfra_011732 [Botrytis fragariae]
MSRHHPDLVMCRKQSGIAIGRLCDKCDGKCPVCDSYVRPTTLVRICEECSFGNYQNKCVVCGGEGISDAFYCFECTRLEKDRDGCPKIINLGSSRTDLFYHQSISSKPQSQAAVEISYTLLSFFTPLKPVLPHQEQQQYQYIITKQQANMSNSKPPAAPVISPITSDTPNLPTAPMGRKSSSIYFHQPTSNDGSSSNANRDNDTDFYASIEHGILLGLRGLPHTSKKRRKHQVQLIEEIPEFSLPGPANTRSVEGSGAFNTSTKRTADESIAKNTEFGDLAENHGGGTLKSKRIKRRASDSVTMTLRRAEESKTVSFRRETSVIPTRSLEELKLDDDFVDGDGSRAGERK